MVRRLARGGRRAGQAVREDRLGPHTARESPAVQMPTWAFGMALFPQVRPRRPAAARNELSNPREGCGQNEPSQRPVPQIFGNTAGLPYLWLCSKFVAESEIRHQCRLRVCKAVSAITFCRSFCFHPLTALTPESQHHLLLRWGRCPVREEAAPRVQALQALLLPRHVSWRHLCPRPRLGPEQRPWQPKVPLLLASAAASASCRAVFTACRQPVPGPSSSLRWLFLRALARPVGVSRCSWRGSHLADPRDENAHVVLHSVAASVSLSLSAHVWGVRVAPECVSASRCPRGCAGLPLRCDREVAVPRVRGPCGAVLRAARTAADSPQGP